MMTPSEALDWLLQNNPQAAARIQPQAGGPPTPLPGLGSINLANTGPPQGGNWAATPQQQLQQQNTQNNLSVSTPRDPFGLQAPETDEERYNVSQGGWGAAAEAVAPLLSDWRTTPAAMLAAAVGGYRRGSYGARQDVAAGRKDSMQAQLAGMQLDEAQKKTKREDEERARVEELVAGLPPEQQKNFRLLHSIGADEQAANLVAPAPMTPYQAEQVRLEEAKIAQAGQPTWYQQAQIALERDQLNAAKNQPRAPSWETVQDPTNPSLSMIIDKNTMAPVMGPDGHPLRPAASRDTGAAIKNAKDLRDAHTSQTAEARSAATQYLKIKGGFDEDTGAGDIAGVFGFMKSIDPTSTVREGEVATAENAAGISQSLMNLYNRTVKGERLAPAARKQILGAAGSQVKAYKSVYEQTTNNFRNLAEKQELDPSQVIMPFEWPNMGEEQFKPLPPGGMLQTGPAAGSGLIASAAASPAMGAPKPTISAKKIVSDILGD